MSFISIIVNDAPLSSNYALSVLLSRSRDCSYINFKERALLLLACNAIDGSLTLKDSEQNIVDQIETKLFPATNLERELMNVFLFLLLKSKVGQLSALLSKSENIGSLSKIINMYDHIYQNTQEHGQF